MRTNYFCSSNELIRRETERSMSLMISEIYDAFIAAGAPEEKARKAAGAMTVHENRFPKIENELAVLRWMVGFVIALLSAVALKLLLR
jgi:hypothetical protein